MRFGIDKILEHVLHLTDRLNRGLYELGAEVLTPVQDRMRSGIVTARFRGVNGEAVARELNRRGVIVSPRFGATRISPHLYNSEDDIDHALEEIRNVLRG
jgi:cysteine desulfurase/selenocysteine lyase